MKFRVVVPFAVAVLALAGCSQGESSPSASLSPTAVVSASPSISALVSQLMSEADAAKLQKQVAKTVATSGGELTSLVVGVWDPDKGFAVAAAGDAVTDPQRAASADDQFRIASITKTFVSTLVLQQVAQGTIDLDGTVAEYDPELAAKYPQIGTRTIRQLLSMRSGLPDFEKTLTGSAASNPEFSTKTWTADDLIAAAMSSGKVTKADAKKAVYSNTNYIVLGQVLEAVTGKSVKDLVTENIIEPLNLTRTVYPDAADTSLSDPHSNGYIAPSGVEDLTADGGTIEPGTDVTDWSASWGGAAGVMSSTIQDLAIWAATGFGSDLLPPGVATERASFTPLTAGGEYGLGLQHFGDWTGHTGGIPGWSTLAMRNDKTGTVVVMATNSSGQYGGLLHLGLLLKMYPGTVTLD